MNRLGCVMIRILTATDYNTLHIHRTILRVHVTSISHVWSRKKLENNLFIYVIYLSSSVVKS